MNSKLAELRKNREKHKGILPKLLILLRPGYPDMRPVETFLLLCCKHGLDTIGCTVYDLLPNNLSVKGKIIFDFDNSLYGPLTEN